MPKKNLVFVTAMENNCTITDTIAKETVLEDKQRKRQIFVREMNSSYNENIRSLSFRACVFSSHRDYKSCAPNFFLIIGYGKCH